MDDKVDKILCHICHNGYIRRHGSEICSLHSGSIRPLHFYLTEKRIELYNSWYEEQCEEHRDNEYFHMLTPEVTMVTSILKLIELESGSVEIQDIIELLHCVQAAGEYICNLGKMYNEV